MIFQEPMTSLNPVMTIGDQIAETVRLQFGGKPRRGAQSRDRDAAPGQDPPIRRNAPERTTRTNSAAAAPARHDCHGARVHASPPHRGRADHGARRDDPGANPGPHRRLSRGFGIAVLLITHDLGVVARDVPASRRHVRRQNRRKRKARSHFLSPQASLHDRALGLAAGPARRQNALRGNSRHGPEPARLADSDPAIRACAPMHIARRSHRR